MKKKRKEVRPCPQSSDLFVAKNGSKISSKISLFANSAARAQHSFKKAPLFLKWFASSSFSMKLLFSKAQMRKAVERKNENKEDRKNEKREKISLF